MAIKCLNRERMQNPSEFLDEAAIMHTIDHEHIVRLYGVVLEPKAAMLVCFVCVCHLYRACSTFKFFSST